MADNLFRVQAVSPELASLLRRVKTIYAITGGEVPKTGSGKKDDFHAKKSVLLAQLHNFDKLIDARDNAGLATDSRDYIRLKNTINIELVKLEDMVKDVADTHKKEVEKKGTKLTGEEIAARKEVMESVITEFHTAFKNAKGFGHKGAEENLGGGVGLNVIGADALMKGQYSGAGIKTRKEALSGEQLQKLEEINASTKEQDAVLDEISKGMDELKDLAEKMHDELQLQDKMLTDLDAKTDKTQGQLDNINDRMKDTLAKLNEKSTNVCCYLICLILILGIGTVAYSQAKKSGAIK